MQKEKKARVMSNLLWKFAERISAQLVSTVVSIVLARILLPEDYGIVSIVMILITICNALVTGGLGNALIQKKDADNVDFSTVFYFSIGLSLIIYILVCFVAAPVAKYYNNEIMKPIICVMGLMIPFAAINSVQQAYISKNMQFRKFFYASMVGIMVSAIVGIVMATNGFGVWALVGQYLSNMIVNTVVLFFVSEWKPKLQFSVNRLTTLLPYGVRIMGVSLSDAIFNEIRGIIISARYSPRDLAIYDNGKKYPMLLVNNINSSIGSVVFPAMSQAQNDQSSIKQMMKKAIKMVTYTVAPLLLGFFAVANRFIEVVLTSKWADSLPFIYLTCIMCLFYPIHTINIQALNAIGRSEKTFGLEIIKKIINVVILVLSMNRGVLIIALGAFVVSLISTYINSFYSKRYFDYSFGEQMKDIVPYLALSVCMCIAVLFIDSTLQINGIIAIIIDCLLGVVIYVGGSFIFKFDVFFVLIQYIKQFVKR